MAKSTPASRLARIKKAARAGSIVLPATAVPEAMDGFLTGRTDTPVPGKGEVVACEVDLRPNCIIIRYGMRAMGFGELTIYAQHRPENIHGFGSLGFDTECMSAKSIERVLIAAAPALAKLMVEKDHEGET